MNMPTTSRAELRAPAEWEPHAGALMAWPHNEDGGWGGRLPAAQDEIATIARTIARFEPVIMVAEPGTADDARRACGDAVTVIEHPVDDCWTRDTAPVFALDPTGTKVTGLDFTFNGWGGQFPHDKDNLLPARACEYLEVPRKPVDMVLEGGAVLTDGEGTLITTEECLLHPNRNPHMSRAEIESTLLAAYGAEKLIWLPYGLDGDDTTNGHVDLVAAYLAPAEVLLHTQPDTSRRNHARMEANKAVLQGATDARGRSFELVELHQQPHYTLDGDDVVTFSYTNYYLTEAAVIVPTSGTAEDELALARLRPVFPGREVIGVPAATLAWGGGGVHCVTQHIPRAR
ncbi:agmatine deiminase family protein [Streptomyces sp. NPDC101150]|uniref:agmatine deiminase family protein n=1 Tax=Streptomyces sp. NPDC101150 TaxID=3366114 RepID=UPI00381D27CB